MHKNIWFIIRFNISLGLIFTVILWSFSSPGFSAELRKYELPSTKQNYRPIPLPAPRPSDRLKKHTFSQQSIEEKYKTVLKKFRERVKQLKDNDKTEWKKLYKKKLRKSVKMGQTEKAQYFQKLLEILEKEKIKPTTNGN